MFVAVIATVAAITSCESPQHEAMKELQERKLDVSGATLLRAVEENDTELLKLMLSAGVFTGHRDAEGRTPLYRAIEEGQLDAAWMLIDSEADVNAEGPGKVTPLALAVVAGEAALADRLLKAGARPDGRTPDGSKLLPWAIRHGRLAFVRALMKNGADPHQKDSNGNPLLHVAMEVGRKDLAAELIELGADCGAINGESESALVAALRNGWRDQIESLIRSGADPNLPDRDGATPLERAFEEQDYALARQLMNQGAVLPSGVLNARLAAAYEQRDLVKCRDLLGFGANPSPARNDCLVRRAAAEDQPRYLHLFLGYSKVPEDLLYEYCRSGREHIASILLAHGASPNPSRAPFLDTPFMSALTRGSDRLALRLLDGGAHPGLAGGWGAKPLHVAIASGKPGVVERLLASGVDVNQPLESPADENFLKMVKGSYMRWMLRKDIRVTPLMVAVDSGSVETARALLASGANKSVRTGRYSIWPINVAGKNSDVRMMRLLLGKDPYVEERQVIINLTDQELRVYGAAGDEIFKTKVSTGKRGYETPTGTFAVTNRYRHWTSTIYNAGMPYFQRLSCSDFGFHRGYVPGYPASHGCIRVPSDNAAKLFTLLDLGDRVRIVD